MSASGGGRFQTCSPRPYRVAASAQEADTTMKTVAKMASTSSAKKLLVMWARVKMRIDTMTATSTMNVMLTFHTDAARLDLSARSILASSSGGMLVNVPVLSVPRSPSPIILHSLSSSRAGRVEVVAGRGRSMGYDVVGMLLACRSRYPRRRWTDRRGARGDKRRRSPLG